MRLLIYLLFLYSYSANTQTPFHRTTPKIVIGIVIDQMRYDYLHRFYDQFEEDGFKRIIDKGFACKNAHYNYSPTSTGPGHASIYTGSTPSVHGIINNQWYSKEEQQIINCVSDDSVQTIGSQSVLGKYSPKNLLVPTITDELRLSSNWRSMVFSVSIKNRGAILPGGRTANAAYWFDLSNGNFITSSWYDRKLPSWLTKFNERHLPDELLKKTWTPVLEPTKYDQSRADSNKYEAILKGKNSPSFPYTINNLSSINQRNKYSLLAKTPFGNQLVLEMVGELLSNEPVGKDKFTDFICISLSSTDYIGHTFGPASMEIQDTYIRLDGQLAELLKFLDRSYGPNDYTIFLTADHAVQHVPQYLSDHKLSAGYVDHSKLKEDFATFCKSTFGQEIHLSMGGNQIFMDWKSIEKLNLDRTKTMNRIKHFLFNHEDIHQVFTATELQRNSSNNQLLQNIQNGYHQKRSGDIFYFFKPGYQGKSAINNRTKRGTTHGSVYNYDTQVPILLYGHGIKHGTTVRRVKITDITPTLAELLNLQLPAGTIGQPIFEAIKK